MKTTFTMRALCAMATILYVASAHAQQWEGRGTIGTAPLRGIAVSRGVVVAAGDAGLYRSIDDGTTWVLQESGAFSSVVAVGDGRFVAAAFDGRLMRSASGGATWSTPYAGLPKLASLRTLAIDEGVVVVGTSLGVFRGGVDSIELRPLLPDGLGNVSIWSVSASAQEVTAASYSGPWALAATDSVWHAPLDPPLFAIAAARIDVTRYLGTLDGIRWSVDGGASWSASGADSMPAVFALLAHREHIFAGAADGVHVGTMARWARQSDGLPSDAVMSLGIDSVRLWAGTWAGEIYSRPLSAFSIAPDEGTSSTRATLRIQHLLPSPAAARIVVRWNAARDADVTVALTDVRGVECLHATVGSHAGENALELRVDDMPNGVYNCTVTDGEESDHRAVVIAR
ncbi:MAG TPA: hypothetical protein VNA88_13270 [Candidatus Kapabacteria bacterium]|jgi:hypothetical protein|nr:hypothetical protein [Candidatus Kapabacteria bacterium]